MRQDKGLVPHDIAQSGQRCIYIYICEPTLFLSHVFSNGHSHREIMLWGIVVIYVAETASTGENIARLSASHPR